MTKVKGKIIAMLIRIKWKTKNAAMKHVLWMPMRHVCCFVGY